MAIIDWVIIAVLAVSALISLKRGFVKEALSLTSWVLAFIVARMFSAHLATLLAGSIETESLRWIIAFAVLFVGTVVVGALLSHAIAQLIHASGLTGTDRVFGMFFGLVRGLVILIALVYGLQLTAAPNDPWWQESQFIPYLSTVANWAGKTLPQAAGNLDLLSQ